MTPDTLQKLQDLETFESLVRGWNGYNGSRIPRIALEYAQEFINYCIGNNEEEFLNNLILFPFDGGVQFEVMSPKNNEPDYYYEIDFSKTEVSVFFFKNEQLGLPSRQFDFYIKKVYNIGIMFKSIIAECKANQKLGMLASKERRQKNYEHKHKHQNKRKNKRQNKRRK